MKFIDASPDIPDELIREVNAGEVVFLCGAGVSKGANLPLFKELTDRVYERIGETQDNEAAERVPIGAPSTTAFCGHSKNEPFCPGQTRACAKRLLKFSPFRRLPTSDDMFPY